MTKSRGFSNAAARATLHAGENAMPLPDLLARLPQGWMKKNAPIVALTGAGGKTTLLQALALALTHAGWGVISTTTTHIMPPNDPARSPLVSAGLVLAHDRPLPDVADELAAFFRREPCGHISLGLSRNPDSHKVRGLSPAQLCQLRDRLICGTIDDGKGPCWLVEADGAARRPLKAHAAHEPQIPPDAELVIAVAGLDALGKSLDEAVHRPDLAAEQLSCAIDATVTPAAMAALLLAPGGPFRMPNATHMPLQAVFLNKTDAAPPGAAEEMARLLLSRAPNLSVLASSLKT